MRKLLVILNAMLAKGTAWRTPQPACQIETLADPLSPCDPLSPRTTSVAFEVVTSRARAEINGGAGVAAQSRGPCMKPTLPLLVLLAAAILPMTWAEASDAVGVRTLSVPVSERGGTMDVTL